MEECQSASNPHTILYQLRWDSISLEFILSTIACGFNFFNLLTYTFLPFLLKVILSTIAFTAFELPTNGAVGTKILEFLFHARSDLVSTLFSVGIPNMHCINGNSESQFIWLLHTSNFLKTKSIEIKVCIVFLQQMNNWIFIFYLLRLAVWLYELSLQGILVDERSLWLKSFVFFLFFFFLIMAP